MTEINIDRDLMNQLLDRPLTRTQELTTVLNGISAAPDGGAASEEISVLVQIALESAQLVTTITDGACTAAKEAVKQQFETEQEAVDYFKSFESVEAPR